MKTDEVTITITGTKKFRQEVVNTIHEILVVNENVCDNVKITGGESIKISSTLEPQWDEIV